jgi:hypothetical protein
MRVIIAPDMVSRSRKYTNNVCKQHTQRPESAACLMPAELEAYYAVLLHFE